ncbi:response regulator transcription factor [Spirosoma pollinicola]|uniref:DNA-binding response regulator n=1 Tax=Spirosoma pollinicola TaxID=2057025 RepID=A0A2K8Z3S2_9BACT|nr:response regulator transcription factor [Spirosoma pollinicola]AUD04512.1 DNA-binding response regulator [Spirosoma pollinicola]
MPVSIAIADDHHLVAAALSDMIRKFEEYDVLLVAENGRDLLDQLALANQLPDIVLLDVSMPEMDGFETALCLRQLYPAIKVLALSMDDREEHIVKMIRNGARGYLLKGCRPTEFRRALDEIMIKGFYYSDFLTTQLIRNLNAPAENGHNLPFNLNSRELEFLKIACSELTYSEIAEKMFVSPRTVDGYREVVFQKMNVKTRVGMVLEAMRHGLVEL